MSCSIALIAALVSVLCALIFEKSSTFECVCRAVVRLWLVSLGMLQNLDQDSNEFYKYFDP